MDIISLKLIFENFFAFIFMVFVLVTFHELGHFWMARRNNILVEVFSIGFGPEIFSWTDKVGTRWRVSLIPLGGYVKFFGEMSLLTLENGQKKRPEVRSSIMERMFVHQPLSVRALVVLAGPVANFVLAFLLLFGLFVFHGQLQISDPQTALPQVQYVLPNSVAENAGLEVGDIILQIDDQVINSFNEVWSILTKIPGEDVTLLLQRGEQEVYIDLTVGAYEYPDGSVMGRIGIINQKVQYVRTGLVEGSIIAVRTVVGMFSSVVKGGVRLFTGEGALSDKIGGPLLMANLSGNFARAGFATFIQLMALFSVNLGVLNLLPIPALDGGHLMFYIFESVAGRPVSPKLYKLFFVIGFGLLLTFMLFITLGDIVRYI